MCGSCDVISALTIVSEWNNRRKKSMISEAISYTITYTSPLYLPPIHLSLSQIIHHRIYIYYIFCLHQKWWALEPIEYTIINNLCTCEIAHKWPNVRRRRARCSVENIWWCRAVYISIYASPSRRHTACEWNKWAERYPALCVCVKWRRETCNRHTDHALADSLVITTGRHSRAATHTHTLESDCLIWWGAIWNIGTCRFAADNYAFRYVPHTYDIYYVRWAYFIVLHLFGICH